MENEMLGFELATRAARRMTTEELEAKIKGVKIVDDRGERMTPAELAAYYARYEKIIKKYQDFKPNGK